MAAHRFEFIHGLKTFLALKRSGQKKKLMLFAGVAILFFLFIFVLGGNYGLINIWKLHREKQTLNRDIERLKSDGKKLNDQIEALKTDKKAIERFAREVEEQWNRE